MKSERYSDLGTWERRDSYIEQVLKDMSVQHGQLCRDKGFINGYEVLISSMMNYDIPKSIEFIINNCPDLTDKKIVESIPGSYEGSKERVTRSVRKVLRKYKLIPSVVE
jgi:hypothetical protein